MMYVKCWHLLWMQLGTLTPPAYIRRGTGTWITKWSAVMPTRGRRPAAMHLCNVDAESNDRENCRERDSQRYPRTLP